MRDELSSPGAVRSATTAGWPAGYVYAAARHADAILRATLTDRCDELLAALDAYRPNLDELHDGRNGVAATLAAAGPWSEQCFTLEQMLRLDSTGQTVHRSEQLELASFGQGSPVQPLPGVGVEVAWDAAGGLVDRYLAAFEALHAGDVVAVGVIVTRGPGLEGPEGASVWHQAIERAELAGGSCPLLLAGLEPWRIAGAERGRLKAVPDAAITTT